jgi:hypothetical protein
MSRSYGPKWPRKHKPWAMLCWPLRAKDLRSGNLEMSKLQGPIAKTKIAFRAQRTTVSTYFQS